MVNSTLSRVKILSIIQLIIVALIVFLQLQGVWNIHTLFIAATGGFMGFQSLVAVLHKKPESGHILCCAIVSGFTTAIIAVYVFLLLSQMLIIMDDSTYEEWKDNFTKQQVISAFFCGLVLNLITVALFAQILRLYAYNEEKKNLTYLIRS